MREIPKAMHEEIYNLTRARFLGYKLQKNPLDLMTYQNLIYDIRPDVLVETGTWFGGSALYFATIMDAIDHGIVITVDTWNWINRPRHSRIFYVEGSSVDPNIVKTIQTYTLQSLRVLVVLDSLHTKDHVLQELDIYGPMVTSGSYMVVEDTNIHGHPIREDLPEGPWEAVHEWLPKHSEFEIDKNLESISTNSPDGWLRKRR